jgi:hypothetical protein
MTHISLKPGWVRRIINGAVMEPIEMKFCEICRAYTVETHNHVEPVEPEVRIAGLLTEGDGG